MHIETLDQLSLSESQPPSSLQPSTSPSCRRSFFLLFSHSLTTLAQFFECDQHFSPLSIAPFQPHFIKDHNPLISLSSNKQQLQNQNGERNEEELRDDMLIAHDEGDLGWGKLMSCKWWKGWLCCAENGEWEGEEGDWEEDMYEKRLGVEGVEDEKGSRGGESRGDLYLGEDVGEKADVVYEEKEKIAGQPVSSSNPNLHLHSLPSTYSNPPTLNPTTLIVNSKNPSSDQFPGDIGIKRRPRREFKDTIPPKQSSSPIQLRLYKISQYNNGRNKINSPSETDQKFIMSDLRDEKKGTEKVMNVKDDFDQLGEALDTVEYGRREIKHSKTSVIQTKQSPSKLISHNEYLSSQPSNNLSRINQSQIHFLNPDPIFFQNNDTAFTAPPDGNKDFDDGMRKRRKRARNLFDEEIVLMGDLDVVDEMAPEDLTKKKRRRRRKTILNEVKEQEERAQRRREERVGQELEVVLYDQDEEDR